MPCARIRTSIGSFCVTGIKCAHAPHSPGYAAAQGSPHPHPRLLLLCEAHVNGQHIQTTRYPYLLRNNALPLEKVLNFGHTLPPSLLVAVYLQATLLYQCHHSPTTTTPSITALDSFHYLLILTDLDVAAALPGA